MQSEVAEVLEGKRRWTVVHGDCLDVLPTLPADSIDSCVTDVPYELTSGGVRGFMGKTWDGTGLAFDPDTFRKVLRVLKPGAHMLVFGGTRTYHRIACAIEDAGFEIRDSIAVFCWLYSTGFPKSTRLNLDPRFCQCAEPVRSDGCTDREQSPAGHTGTVAAGLDGDRSLEDAQRSTQTDQDSLAGYRPGHGSSGALEYAHGFPLCNACHRPFADGIGSALKPAFEPVIVARKPLDGTLASNALKYGTGGLNIDACRVATNWDEPDRPDSWKRSGHTDKPEAEKIAAPAGNGIECHPGGRWPPNVAFCHHPECERRGSKTAKLNGSGVATESGGERVQHVANAPGKVLKRRVGFSTTPGLETVAAYDCHADCPVRKLEEQSGQRPGFKGFAPGSERKASKGGGGYNGDFPTPLTSTGHADTGTAARFFPQFEIDDDTLFLYCAKAARAERELGCERLPARTGAEAVERAEGSVGVNNPRAGAGRTAEKVRNNHPTVKALDLIRWLVRLATPKDGVCLDFTCGSGTTGIAALLEDRRFLGVELNDTESEPYATIARARIGYHQRLGVQRSLFSEPAT